MTPVVGSSLRTSPLTKGIAAALESGVEALIIGIDMV
jgi:hypothetical protein